jgi:hypothetical protein
VDDAVIRTKRDLPVLIGHHQEHIMAQAEVFRTPEKVLVQITGYGPEGQLLAELLEQAEPIALYFGAIPVQNIREKREN